MAESPIHNCLKRLQMHQLHLQCTVQSHLTLCPSPLKMSRLTHVCKYSRNDCATYPFEGPPNARSNTCIGLSNCLNLLTNLTPWKKQTGKLFFESDFTNL